jgi:hypothetical protein
MRIQSARPRPQAQRLTDGAWGSIYKKRRMFKIPAYDPFSIVLMSAGALLAAKFALSFLI